MTEQKQQPTSVENITDEPLLNAPTGVEARIYALISPVCAQLGFRLVRVRLLGLNGLTLQIMAERFDGTMSVEDCELLSQNISPVLDVEDVVDRQYNLEVSSPGMDRPLVRKSDFVNWCGHIARIETHNLVEGRKKFRGLIIAVKDDHVVFQYNAKDVGETEVKIPLEQINEAHLILTDELINAALERDKQAKKKAKTDK